MGSSHSTQDMHAGNWRSLLTLHRFRTKVLLYFGFLRSSPTVDLAWTDDRACGDSEEWRSLPGMSGIRCGGFVEILIEQSSPLCLAQIQNESRGSRW